MDESKLRDLNLSDDEIGRLEKAFSNDKFRDLFAQYLKEMQDPENQKAFENEVIELERERGNDVLLIKPTPHYVLKTSVNGDEKAYVNFACSSSVNELSYVPARKDLINGFSLSVPYSLSPARRTRDKCNRLCNVYCVVFHPTTLNYADKNDAVKKAVQETAFSAIENSLKVRLDRVNFRTSKKKSKGPLEMTIVRKNSNTDANRGTFANVEVNDQVFNSFVSEDYVTPTYKIKYRNEVDLQNSRTDKYCKMDILVPKKVLIEIHLPLLKSIQNTVLDVLSTSVKLINEDPRYKLQLTLPYEVNEDSGSATFNADSRILTLQLDVKKKITHTESIPLIEEISNNPCETLNNDSSVQLNSKAIDTNEMEFLGAQVKYRLPQFVCNYHKDTLAFIIKVKNVVRSSFEHVVFENTDGFWVKFYSLGSGHFPMYYSMRIVFAESFLMGTNSLDYKIEDDQVFLYVRLRQNSRPLEYVVGVDADHEEKAYLDEVDALMLKYENEKPETKDVKLVVTEIDAKKVVINMLPPDVKDPTKCANVTVKEELLFDHQKPINAHFPKLCDRFRTQFTLDEESHSLSESELLVRDTVASNGARQTNSDAENGSWISTKTGARKVRRKKKVRNKNSLVEESIVEDGVAEINESSNEIIDEAHEGNAVSQPIDIKSAYRYSDLSSRSILKKNRSFSESSGDESFFMEYSRSYSADGINFSSDSNCPSGSKKTVTFNDVISKKLFCSDISILEQRKRQRRHSRRKARRASDSENSETENGEAGSSERRENIRMYNETLFSETASETDLTSSLSESSGETSDDQGEFLESCESEGVRRPPKKAQPVPSSKKNHKRRGKKSARKNASSAKYLHHDDALV